MDRDGHYYCKRFGYRLAAGTLLGAVVLHGISVNAQERSGDAAVGAVLTRLEKAGTQWRSLTCEVNYKVMQLIRDDPDDVDQQEYTGTLKFLREQGKTLTLIHLPQWNDGTVRYKDPVWYVFDGHWLTEAKGKNKMVIRRELVSADQKGDPFKLGEGPFPLPFGQTEADMLQQFDIVYKPPVSGDPEKCDHLVCIPKSGTAMAGRYQRIELFVIQETSAGAGGLPARIIAHNHREQTLQTTMFTGFEVNPKLRVGDFSLPKEADGWEVLVEPLPSGDEG